jgi:hypothetical protein
LYVLQTAKATKEQIQPEVEALIALKTEYKTLTGQDFGAPAAATKPAEEKVAGKQKQAPTAENAAKKAAKKEARRGGGEESESQPAASGATATTPAPAPATAKAPAAAAAAAAQPAPSAPKGLHYYPSPDTLANTKCWLVALTAGVTMTVGESASAPHVPRWPAVVDNTTGATIFGANAVCLYLALHGAGKGTPAGLLPAQGESTSTVEQVLDVEEFQLAPAVHAKVHTVPTRRHKPHSLLTATPMC